MRGLAVFNDNHELLYLKGDKELRSLLRRRQLELQSEPVNEENISINASGSRSFDGCDSITAAYIFLPLIVCYQSMKCMKINRYISIRSASVCFHFAEFKQDSRLLLLALGDGNSSSEEMDYRLDNFICVLEFVFGPLAASMANSRMESQTQCLDFALRNVSNRNYDQRDQEFCVNKFFQSTLQIVDANAWSVQNSPSELVDKSHCNSALSWIGGQLNAVLRCQLCLLIRDGVILECFSSTLCATSNSSLKKGAKGEQNEKAKMAVKAAHLITLITTATEYRVYKSGKSAPESSCHYCYTVALHQGSSESSEPAIFSDVFCIDLSDDLHLLCISQATHSDLLYDLVNTISIIERLDQLRIERSVLLSRGSKFGSSDAISKANKVQSFYDFWLDQLEIRTRLLCDRLEDRLIFMEGSKQHKVAKTFQDLHQNLRDLLIRNRRPDVTRVGREGEQTAALKSLRRLAEALLMDTFFAATDEARRYKLEKLDRFWRNISLSYSYMPMITNLTDCFSQSTLVTEGPPASRYALDALAYVIVLPKRRLLFSNGLNREDLYPHLRVACRTLKEMMDPTSPYSKLSCQLIYPKGREGKTDNILVFFSATKSPTNSSGGGLMSKLASVVGVSSGETYSINQRRKDIDTGELINEPLQIMCVYEPFINGDLAFRQTRELAVHLYGRAKSMHSCLLAAP